MSELLKVARRNLRQYLSKASFSSEVDKKAALACLDVIEEALPSGNAALVADDAMIERALSAKVRRFTVREIIALRSGVDEEVMRAALTAALDGRNR